MKDVFPQLKAIKSSAAPSSSISHESHSIDLLQTVYQQSIRIVELQDKLQETIREKNKSVRNFRTYRRRVNENMINNLDGNVLEGLLAAEPL